MTRQASARFSYTNDADDADSNGNTFSESRQDMLPQITEALRPLVQQMKNELRQEILDAQFALMEQNFRMNVELRADLEDLRRTVHQIANTLQQNGFPLANGSTNKGNM